MTLKQYNWTNGPDLIQQHSVAKHRILEAYLAAYFRTLVSSPVITSIAAACVDRAWTSRPTHVIVPVMAGPPH